jgi:hypothetical protein
VFWGLVGFGLQRLWRRLPFVVLLAACHAAAYYGPPRLNPSTQVTAADRLAALEANVTDLARRVTRASDPLFAVVGGDAALTAIMVRTDELATNAGRLPADAVSEQLDILERDFEMRELMVSGGMGAVDERVASIRADHKRYASEAAGLRTELTDSESGHRLDAVDMLLENVARDAPQATGGSNNVEIRKKFDAKIAALRKRIG